MPKQGGVPLPSPLPECRSPGKLAWSLRPDTRVIRTEKFPDLQVLPYKVEHKAENQEQYRDNQEQVIVDNDLFPELHYFLRSSILR